MGLFSKDSKLKFAKIPSTPEQKRARGYLETLYQDDMQFPTQGVADMTGTQRDIQSQLGDVMASYGGDYDAAANYYRDVLGGGYDPRTSDFYQGFRQEADTLRQRGQLDVARQAQKAGMARSTPVTGVQGRVGAEYDSKILQALGGLYDNERTRQTHAAGALPALTGQRVNTMSQANQLADAPRQIEQLKLNALFKKAMDTLLAPYTYQAQIASALLSEQRYVGYQTGGGLTDLGFMANLVASAAGGGGGGGFGTGTPGGGGGGFSGVGGGGGGFSGVGGGGGIVNRPDAFSFKSMGTM